MSQDICYENLANAIVLQAVRDYRKVLKHLSANPGSWTDSDEKRDLEAYFRSADYKRLTALDGEMLIRRLRKEAGH